MGTEIAAGEDSRQLTVDEVVGILRQLSAAQLQFADFSAPSAARDDAFKQISALYPQARYVATRFPKLHREALALLDKQRKTTDATQQSSPADGGGLKPYPGPYAKLPSNHYRRTIVSDVANSPTTPIPESEPK